MCAFWEVNVEKTQIALTEKLYPFIPVFEGLIKFECGQNHFSFQIWVSFKKKTEMQTYYEPSHQELHCLQNMFWSMWLKGLIVHYINEIP